jgi:hypothetical protein
VVEIGNEITLNGTISEDNSNDPDNFTYRWDLDTTVDSDNDGFPENDFDEDEPVFNFTPKRTGPHPIALWVTDKSGNIGNSTNDDPRMWTIEVLGTDLRMAPVKEEINRFVEISNKKPKEGKRVTFTVNVTNENDVTAYDIIVTMLVDGKKKSTRTVDELGQGEFEIVKFKWRAKGVKKHNISFNVSMEHNNSYEQFWDNNERSIDLRVRENKQIEDEQLAIIIVVIIVVLIVIAYFKKTRGGKKSSEGKKKKKGKGKKGKDKKKDKDKDKDEDEEEEKKKDKKKKKK